MKTQKVKKLKDFKKFAIKKKALNKLKGGIGNEDVPDN